MENREHVLDDYFKLRVMLNRTNLIRDQKTEIEFIALKKPLGFGLIATLEGVKNPKHIELCTQDNRGRWRPTEYSGLFYLENFCAIFLRKHLRINFSKEEIDASAAILKTELQSLGISRN